MRTKTLTFIVAMGALMLSSCTSMQRGSSSGQVASNVNSSEAVPGQAPTVSPEILSRYTQGWPDTSVSAAKKILSKYGEPTEHTQSMLTWYGMTPFKRITVYREEVLHRFPLLHKDVVEHVVSFRIPADKVGEIAKFDGSVIVDRTRGELTARSDDEAMNVLALNLASDIINGKRSASNARTEYSKVAVDFLNGNKSVLTQGLQFVGQGNTADADQSAKLNWAQAQETRTESANQPQQNKKELLKQSQEELAQ